MEINRIHFTVGVFSSQNPKTHFSNLSKKKYLVGMLHRVALYAWNQEGQNDLSTVSWTCCSKSQEETRAAGGDFCAVGAPSHHHRALKDTAAGFHGHIASHACRRALG